ncbi:uncharacterized protein [Leptinotarsa decemlineata]|uniref:uncharacterized protein n=1 Tax=Leptinotarsa decemlineata TaxID=7539 RepID=UPI003D30A974
MLKFTVFLILLSRVSCQNCSLGRISAEVLVNVDSEVEKVDFSGKVELPEDNFQLFINQQNLPRLCENSIHIINELSILQVRNSNLLTIDPGAFNIAPALALLKISYNPLTVLRAGVFNKVRTKEIDVSHNFISVIEKETFDNNSWLEVVSLSHNAIKHLDPDWFQNSPNVYKISIIYNELTKVPDEAFRNMAKDRGLKLRLSANMISEVAEKAFEGIETVQNLWMNGNKLRSLPTALFNNISIINLELNTNNLLCFPENMYGCGLKKLQFLDNQQFRCDCLNEVKDFVIENSVDIVYPSIICENKTRQVNVVFNFNKTYEIPIFS